MKKTINCFVIPWTSCHDQPAVERQEGRYYLCHSFYRRYQFAGGSCTSVWTRRYDVLIAFGFESLSWSYWMPHKETWPSSLVQHYWSRGLCRFHRIESFKNNRGDTIDGEWVRGVADRRSSRTDDNLANQSATLVCYRRLESSVAEHIILYISTPKCSEAMHSFAALKASACHAIKTSLDCGYRALLVHSSELW